MKDKIIQKATELFLKLGFKSVTMDDIAGEMCISKKTIYKYFCNKDLLIADCTEAAHNDIHLIINTIVSKNLNAIAENFEIRAMFKEMFKSADNSPMYQLKKHYPEIFSQVIFREIEECKTMFRQNILKGMSQGLYRETVAVESAIQFYYTLIFSINEKTASEPEVLRLELEALEYHTRALATPKGIEELEKHLSE